MMKAIEIVLIRLTEKLFPKEVTVFEEAPENS